ncbi:MAG: response regulator [Cyanobacteria bacterium J06636_16]
MDHSRSKILAVDDTPANLEILSAYLTPVGYEMFFAVSGERALKRLQTYQPDLILLDVQMLGIDGFETCRQIKANPNWAAIPIIFITALNDASSIAKGFSLGAVDYISKPFQEAELLARVKTHLHLQQMNQHLEQQVVERTQALEAAMSQLKMSQLQTVQFEKMATLGNLVAGVAHEINNPIGFLNGSVNNAKDHVEDLLGHLTLYQQHYPNPAPAIQDNAEDIDLEFLSEDLPKLLDSMQGATDRIKSISTSLRAFSRSDTEHKVSANLHEGIDSTLLILKYRLKASELRPAIQVIRNYGELPLIDCFPGQLNQVFMNLLSNAIDAVEESNHGRSLEDIQASPNQITVTTRISEEQNHIQISIADNGPGISADVQPKIFEQYFTTKSVGKGTGLGLAISYQVITEKHSGTLSVNSQPGKGAEFVISLPLKLSV